MAELPDMPDDWKKFLVTIGRYSHQKEKAKWEYWQALTHQICFVLLLGISVRLLWGASILGDNLTLFAMAVVAVLSLFGWHIAAAQAKKLRENL